MEVFSWEIYEIYKNTFFTEYLQWLVLCIKYSVKVLRKKQGDWLRQWFYVKHFPNVVRKMEENSLKDFERIIVLK